VCFFSLHPTPPELRVPLRSSQPPSQGPRTRAIAAHPPLAPPSCQPELLPRQTPASIRPLLAAPLQRALRLGWRVPLQGIGSPLALQPPWLQRGLRLLRRRPSLWRPCREKPRYVWRLPWVAPFRSSTGDAGGAGGAGARCTGGSRSKWTSPKFKQAVDNGAREGHGFAVRPAVSPIRSRWLPLCTQPRATVRHATAPPEATH
jgi:hypothetical protein